MHIYGEVKDYMDRDMEKQKGAIYNKSPNSKKNLNLTFLKRNFLNFDYKCSQMVAKCGNTAIYELCNIFKLQDNIILNSANCKKIKNKSQHLDFYLIYMKFWPETKKNTLYVSKLWRQTVKSPKQHCR